jgi:hypothetical protein
MAYCMEHHLNEKFNFSISTEEEDLWMRLMSSFWPTDSKQFVERKLREKAKYNEDVARHFEAKLTTTTKIDLVSFPATSATDNIAR